MRTIKLVAEYQCFPLWEASPGEFGNIDPETLPLSPDLRKRLYEWAENYDATLNMEDPKESRFANAKVESEFWEEGRAIAEDLRVELGGGLLVIEILG